MCADDQAMVQDDVTAEEEKGKKRRRKIACDGKRERERKKETFRHVLTWQSFFGFFNHVTAQELLIKIH